MGEQRSKESKTTAVIWWEGTKVQDEPLKICRGGNREYTERKKGSRETKRERSPCQLFGWRLPLPRHCTHCLQPSPFLLLSWASLSTDSARSKSEGDWCGPVLWAGPHEGLDQLLYFCLYRVQGLHHRGLTAWSESWLYLIQLVLADCLG